MSRSVLTGLLREELHFGGVIVSDALDMAGAASPGGMPETAVRALQAGCDLLCLGTDNTDEEVAALSEAIAAAIADGRLHSGQVEEAAGRVLELTEELATSPPPVPEPSELVQPLGWPPDDSEVIAAFDTQPAARAWPGVLGSCCVVRLETRANIPVGQVPWGPFAAVADEPTSTSHAAFATQPQYEVSGEDSPLPATDSEVPILVVGRDIHRSAFAPAVVDRLRAEHPSAAGRGHGLAVRRPPLRRHRDVQCLAAGREGPADLPGRRTRRRLGCSCLRCWPSSQSPCPTTCGCRVALHAGHLQPTSGGDQLGPAVRGGGQLFVSTSSWTWAAARLGLGRLLAASLAMSTAGLLLTAVAPAYWVVVACAVLFGLSAGAVDAALNAYAARHFGPAPHQPDARGVRRRRGDVTADHHRGGELRPRLARGLPGRHDPAGTARRAVHRDRPAVDHGCPHCAAGRSADAADPGISSIAVAAAPARRRGCAGRCGRSRPGDGCGPVGLRLSPRGGGPVDRHGRPAGVRLLGCSRDRPGSARGSDQGAVRIGPCSPWSPSERSSPPPWSPPDYRSWRVSA